MPTNICKSCGKPFEAATKRGRYCAGKCFRAAEQAYSRRHRTTFSPERRRASNLVQSAIYRGELVPQPCEVCAAKRTVAHHDDYAKPLDVRWLCRSDHKKHHNQFGPGRNA